MGSRGAARNPGGLAPGLFMAGHAQAAACPPQRTPPLVCTPLSAAAVYRLQQSVMCWALLSLVQRRSSWGSWTSQPRSVSIALTRGVEP